MGAKSLFTNRSSTGSKAFSEREDVSSETEFSDYSQILSEPEEEEIEKEEDNNVQVILSQTEPYQVR